MSLYYLLLDASIVYAISNDFPDEVYNNVKRGGWINVQNSNGWSPLIYFIARGDYDIVKEFIDLGADVNMHEGDHWTRKFYL